MKAYKQPPFANIADYQLSYIQCFPQNCLCFAFNIRKVLVKPPSLKIVNIHVYIDVTIGELYHHQDY